MPNYRLRPENPVDVDALQWCPHPTNSTDNVVQMLRWLADLDDTVAIELSTVDETLIIHWGPTTDTKRLMVLKTEWVIRNADGEYSKMTNDEFVQNFDAL